MPSRTSRAAPAADTECSTGGTRQTIGSSTSATDADTPGTEAARPTATGDGKQVLSDLWVSGLRSTASAAKRPTTTKLSKREVDDLPPLSYAKRGRRKKGGKGARYIPGVHEQVEEAFRKKLL